MNLVQPPPVASRDDPLRAAQAESLARLQAENVPLQRAAATRIYTAGIAAVAILAASAVAYEVSNARGNELNAVQRAQMVAELERSCILTYETPGRARESGFRANTHSIHAGAVKLQERAGNEFVLVVPIASKTSLSGTAELAVPLAREEAVQYAASIAECFSLKPAKLAPAQVASASPRGPR